MTIKCYTCRDKGTKEGCVKCGTVSALPEDKLKDTLTAEEYSKLYIPEYYKGKLYNPATLHESYPSLATNEKFKHYTSQLGKLVQFYKEGKVPPKSIIINSSVGMAKQVLAYTCMQLAHQHGMTIFPLMDTMQLRRLLYKNTHNMYTRDHTTPDDFQFTLEELITADVVFMSVEHEFSRGNAHETIVQVMDMRARYNKPTVVLTEYSINDISRTDFNKRFNKRFNRTGREDPYRYPILISFTEVI